MNILKADRNVRTSRSAPFRRGGRCLYRLQVWAEALAVTA